jgi:hypothetical protein
LAFYRPSHVCAVDDVLHREFLKAFFLDQGQQGGTEELLRAQHAPAVSSRSHNVLTFPNNIGGSVR